MSKPKVNGKLLAVKIKRAELRFIPGHLIGDEYIDYHNDVIVQE